MGPVTEAGQKARSSVFTGDCASLYPGGGWGTAASDCAATRSPFMGEQFVADDADGIVGFGVR